MPAPTLLTERLELRAHRADDLEGCLRLWRDPAVTRYTSGQPLARPEVWTRLLRHPGHWELLGFGYWLVTAREGDGLGRPGGGRVLGEVGLADFKRDVLSAEADFAGVPETGWVFLPEVHGQGYASEAVRAVLDWRAAHLPGESTCCLIHPENAPSLRLAHRFGFRVVREVGDAGARTLLLRRDGDRTASAPPSQG